MAWTLAIPWGGGLTRFLPFPGSCPGNWSHNCTVVCNLWQHRAVSWHVDLIFSACFPTPMPGKSAPLRHPLLFFDPQDLKPYCHTWDSPTLCHLSTFEPGTCASSPSHSRLLKVLICTPLLLVLCSSLLKQAPAPPPYNQRCHIRCKFLHLLPPRLWSLFYL